MAAHRKQQKKHRQRRRHRQKHRAKHRQRRHPRRKKPLRRKAKQPKQKKQPRQKAKEKTMYVSGDVYMREAADKDAKAMTVLATGKEITVLGEEGDWYQVKVDEQRVCS